MFIANPATHWSFSLLHNYCSIAHKYWVTKAYLISPKATQLQYTKAKNFNS